MILHLFLLSLENIERLKNRSASEDCEMRKCERRRFQSQKSPAGIPERAYSDDIGKGRNFTSPDNDLQSDPKQIHKDVEGAEY